MEVCHRKMLPLSDLNLGNDFLKVMCPEVPTEIKVSADETFVLQIPVPEGTVPVVNIYEI
jgi:hypothetical protein